MSKPQHTLPAVMLISVIETAVRRGARREQILPQGLELYGLPPEAPVALTVMFSIFEAIMRQLRDPAFPLHFARQFLLEQYPVVGFAAMTAPTAREALVRTGRFGALITRSARWHVVEQDGLAEIIFERAGKRTLGHRVANESALAEILSGMQQTLGREIRCVAARFRHERLDDASAHDAYFGCVVTWNAKRDSITLESSLLDEAPRYANLALSTYFEVEAKRRVEALTQLDSVRARVEYAVFEALPAGEPTLVAVAKQLGMSERTLRRALQSEQATFRAVLDSVRQERAKVLLEDRTLLLSEIAFALGFSEHAAFSRAFKRWYGHSPLASRFKPPTQRADQLLDDGSAKFGR